MKQSSEENPQSREIGRFSEDELDFLRLHLGDTLALSQAIPLLEAHLIELATWAPRLNLVAADTRIGWLRRHFLDSLMGAATLQAHFPQGVPLLVDVGSGAGFPGLPLAAFLRPRSTRLLEPRERRSHFLRAVLRRCPGTAVEVQTVRLENVDWPAQNAAVVTRATFSDHVSLLTGARDWLTPGSLVMAFCAPNAKSAVGEATRQEFEPLDSVEYRLPDSATAHQLRLWRRL